MTSVQKPGPLPPKYVGQGKLIEPGAAILSTKKALKSKGFKVLGMGQSQVALAKPRGRRVVKLSAGEKTGGWDAIQMFMAHPEINEFPRVYGVVKLRGGAWAVEMERLKKDVDGEAGWEIERTIDGGGWLVLADTWGVPIADAFGEHWSGYIDLHNENWMLRGGTPVITDPFNNWDGIDDPSTSKALSTIGTRGTLRHSKAGFWGNVH